MADIFYLFPGTIVRNETSWVGSDGTGSFTDSSDAGLIKGLNAQAPYTLVKCGLAAGALTFLIDSTNIVLEGTHAGTYTYGTLPPGFTIATAVINIQATVSGGGSINLLRQNFTIASGISFADFHQSLAANLNLISIINDTYGISYSAGGNAVISWNDVNTFRVDISGTYTSVSYTWTLANNSPVQQGTPVTVTSSGPSGLDFTDILTVTASFTDENGTPRTVNIPLIDWTAVSANQFIFLLQLGGYQPQTVTLSITSTQFSGSVALGTLSTIYFRNAPGIYRIVAGKTNDTLYDVSNPGTTVDVKIPNPLAKTAFVP